MFPILADFLATLRGGLEAQGVACRYGIAVGLLTVRPGRYGKERRAGRQGKQGVACRYGRAVCSSLCAQAGTARKEERAGRRAAGQAVRGRVCQ
jgi:hypothetical protein